MLILTRRLNEEIVINDNIVISILEISEDKVKIGFEAPREFTILRKELLEAVKSTNKESADVSKELIGELSSIYTKKES